MWKQCEHWPHTSGQSSPGTLPVEGPAQSLQLTQGAQAPHPKPPLKARLPAPGQSRRQGLVQARPPGGALESQALITPNHPIQASGMGGAIPKDSAARAATLLGSL